MSYKGYTNEDVKRIAVYVKREQKSGYTIPQLREFLLEKGYEEALVDEAIDSLYSKKLVLSEPQKKFAIVAVALIAFVFIALIGYTLLINTPEVDERGVLTRNIREPVDLREDENKVTESDSPKIRETKGISGEGGRDSGNTEDTTSTLEDDRDAQDNDGGNGNIEDEPSSPDDCALVEDSLRRDQCYLSFAYSERKYDLCEKIENTGKQNLCRSMGRTKERLDADNLAINFKTGEIVPSKEISSESSINVHDYLKLEVEFVE